MSIYCPSCGAAVDADATVCPACGEPLEPVTNASKPLAAAGPGTAGAGRVNCPECGAVNVAGSAECASCGARLDRASASRKANRTPRQSATTRLYLIGFIVLVAITGLIFMLATPEEKVGPPQPQQQSSEGLPEGHPPIDQSGMRARLDSTIAQLEADIKAQPENQSLKLQLANALYDAERHAEAAEHYRAYVAKYPSNLDARTDMATSLAAAGKVDTAVVVLKNVVSESPKHQQATFNLAIIYRQKENRDSVIYWLQQTAAIDSTTPPGKAAVDILKNYESGQVQ